MNSPAEDNSIRPQTSLSASWTEFQGLPPENTLLGAMQELTLIQNEMAKGVSATYDAEVRYVDADNEAQKAYALAFMDCKGTVEDRKQLARLRASESLLKADLAKAEWDRCKLKMKQLELSQMSTQTKARLLEAELKALR